MQKILLLSALLCGSLLPLPRSAGAAAPSAEAPAPGPVGFATVSAYGQAGVTGGRGGPVVEVRTAEEFRAACERTDVRKAADRARTPRIVKVMADLDLGVLANERPGDDLKQVGRVLIGSHTTIYAPGAGATLHHGVLETHGASNIIIRNLRFRDLWELDPTGEYDRNGWDYVRINNSGSKLRSHHIWIDHCDFGRSYDGQVDIVHGSDLVTVSWCRFSGDDTGPQMKSSLLGNTSDPVGSAPDHGRLNVTFHHNWWHHIVSRAPRVRFGNVHFFNNFVEGAENATISVMNAVTLVENSFYREARVATTFSHADDTVEHGRGGTLCLVESRNEEPRRRVPATPRPEPGAPAEATPSPSAQTPPPESGRHFEWAHNFQGNVEREALQFNAPADWPWPDRHHLPYACQPDPVEEVPGLVRESAGVGKIRLP